ncbi:MAG: hypothetical protein L0229_22565 [Blastocatellia bacterium]|nr:hypothetical protein [Blastocatellia bacterium]
MEERKAGEQGSRGAGDTGMEQPAAAQEPEAFKVLLRRVKGVEPLTCVSVEDGRSMRQWYPDPTAEVFEVDIATARAAVDSGGFEVDPKSRVKLKTGGEQ